MLKKLQTGAGFVYNRGRGEATRDEKIWNGEIAGGALRGGHAALDGVVRDGTSAARGKYDFVSHDIDGNVVKLADFASAKVIMLNYWEPWCPPCIRELPELEQLYEAYKD